MVRRISELCPVVQVGIRSLSQEEAGFLRERSKGERHGRAFHGQRSKKSHHASRLSACCRTAQAGITHHGIYTYFAKDIIGGIPAKDVYNKLGENVFVTIDLDVFDPSIMPATGTPEPGGLGWYDVLNLLKAVATKRRVVGFDVVELCPIPGNIAPDFLAARLVYKMMGYISISNKQLAVSNE
ncbi:MAG: arginase family protein [Deltaproteobacteria bacterium]|nr:arginase family protein [Deltaproteobacteria bacterium]